MMKTYQVIQINNVSSYKQIKKDKKRMTKWFRKRIIHKEERVQKADKKSPGHNNCGQFIKILSFGSALC
jgi:hypothetical protein